MFREFVINEVFTLVLENDVWHLYKKNQLVKRPIEEILDDNANEELCYKIRKIISDNSNPFADDEAEEALLEADPDDHTGDYVETDEEPYIPEDDDPEAYVEEVKPVEKPVEPPKPPTAPPQKASRFKPASASPQRKPESPVTPPAKEDTASGTPLLDMIYKYTGHDILELYGATGTGKSKFCTEVAKEAIRAGKTVFYLDTEHNLNEADAELLGKCDYRYTPDMKEIDEICQNLPPADVVIIDSIGFPILTTFARMTLNKKGDALLNMIAIFGDLKKWAYRNKGIVILTNQPESDFNKDKNHVLRPFGDKSQFAAKEIWKTSAVSESPGLTKTAIKTFRSRSTGRGTNVFDVSISNEGYKVAKRP